MIYAKGRGVKKNQKEAIKWYRRAADKGVPEAQFNLGLAYYNGTGIVRNYIQAHKWWNLTASRSKRQALRLKASKNRRIVEDKMTQNQVATAQRLARAWKPKK